MQNPTLDFVKDLN